MDENFAPAASSAFRQADGDKAGMLKYLDDMVHEHRELQG